MGQRRMPPSEIGTGASTVALDSVDFRYRRRGRMILENLSLTLTGESTVIIGPNGAGKSSLLRILAGQLSPTHGQVTSTVSIGYSPQRPVALPAFTVREQVEYCGWLGGLTRAASSGSAKRALQMVDMDKLEGHRATALSGGQLARLGIAGALVLDPQVLLLDEPTAALDPVARSGVTRALVGLVERGTTIIATSHTASDVGRPFDRLLLMDSGQLTFDGTPQAFLSTEHEDVVAAQFSSALRGR